MDVAIHSNGYLTSEFASRLRGSLDAKTCDVLASLSEPQDYEPVDVTSTLVASLQEQMSAQQKPAARCGGNLRRANRPRLAHAFLRRLAKAIGPYVEAEGESPVATPSNADATGLDARAVASPGEVARPRDHASSPSAADEQPGRGDARNSRTTASGTPRRMETEHRPRVAASSEDRDNPVAPIDSRTLDRDNLSAEFWPLTDDSRRAPPPETPAAGPVVDDHSSLRYAGDTLAALDEAHLAAFLRPVKLPSLRTYIRTNPNGMRVQSSFLKGFRVQTLTFARVVRALATAMERWGSSALAQDLLAIWLDDVPSAKAISSEVLGRDNPFNGSVTLEYLDRLEAAIDSDVLAVVRLMCSIDVVPTDLGSLDEDNAATGSTGTTPDGSHTPPPPSSSANPGPGDRHADDRAESSRQSADASSSKRESPGAVGNPSEFPPAIHTDIVDRDLWLLSAPHREAVPKHLEARLLSLVDTADFLQYAVDTAARLEEERHESEAYAYWRAGLRRISKLAGHEAERDAFMAGMLRSAANAAGASIDHGVVDGDAVLEITFSAASTAVRDATIRAFIIASATAGATFDVSLSTARSREAYAEAIAVWKETLPSRYVKRKGTHEILPALVDEYNVRHERLVQAASDVMAASGLQRLMDSRPAVLKALGSIEAFLLPSDRRAAARLRDILLVASTPIRGLWKVRVTTRSPNLWTKSRRCNPLAHSETPSWQRVWPLPLQPRSGVWCRNTTLGTLPARPPQFGSE